MECNPATMGSRKLSGYKKAGVNRISMGLQTTNDEILKEIQNLFGSDFVYDVTLPKLLFQ